MSDVQASNDLSLDIMQLFIDIPGLTGAKGQYEAKVSRIQQSDRTKFAVSFGVKDDAETPDEVNKILKNYKTALVNSDIEGIVYDSKTDQIIANDAVTMAAAINVYLEQNPENLSDDIVDGVGNKINIFMRQLVRETSEKEATQTDDANAQIIKKGMAYRFLALLKQIPPQLCGAHDCRMEGAVQRDGSVQIGFDVGDNNSEIAIQNLKDIILTLDMACAESPDSYSFDTETQSYRFAGTQEMYNWLTSYIGAMIPEDAYTDVTKRTFAVEKAIAFDEALESIVDDYVPSFKLNNHGNAYSKPRSVKAAVLGFKTILDTVEDTDAFYINVGEDKEEGIFTFTIGCSQFTGSHQHDDQFEIVEELFDTLQSHTVGSGVHLEQQANGDNINITVNDLRCLIPFFEAFYTDKNLGGPENVNISGKDKNGNFDAVIYAKQRDGILAAFDEHAKLDDSLSILPMRVYATIEDAKIGCSIASKAPALISIEEIEATISQDYEGGKAISHFTRTYKPFTVH